MRMEEILKLKNQLRLEKETVQQKEIEISRLHGQVPTTRILRVFTVYLALSYTPKVCVDTHHFEAFYCIIPLALRKTSAMNIYL
jgi:hypothetical protein